MKARSAIFFSSLSLFQTELDSTQSYYHYEVFFLQSYITTKNTSPVILLKCGSIEITVIVIGNFNLERNEVSCHWRFS